MQSDDDVTNTDQAGATKQVQTYLGAAPARERRVGEVDIHSIFL